VARRYAPQRGDVLLLQFATRKTGQRLAGHRPALVVSPEAYNRRVGLCLFCPITSHAKGYPFEVPLPVGQEFAGVVLADQLKSTDWVARPARRIGRVPPAVLAEVLAKLATLVS
jgi:mRNA interferase MazF